MEPRPFLKTLSILHLALFLGLVFFSIFAYWQNGNFSAGMDQNDFFIYLVPVLAAAGYFASQFYFRKFLHGIKREERLGEKLGKYQTASLIKYALLESPGFLALFAYYSSGNALYLVTGIALMLYLFSQRPTATRIIKDIPLTLEEQKQFDTLRN